MEYIFFSIYASITCLAAGLACGMIYGTFINQ